MKKIRRLIFTRNTVQQIVHYSRQVFDAIVDIEVVIITKEAQTKHSVLVRLVTQEGAPAVRFVAQSKWAALNGEPINIFADTKQEAVIEKIQTGAILLKELCDVTVGMKPYQVGKGVPKQTRSVVEDRIFDSTTQKSKSYRPLLRGRDIEKFLTRWDGDRWIKYGDHLAEPRPSAKFDAAEKLVIRQTGDSLVATLDDKQFVCMNNMHVIVARDGTCNLRFILGLLNSKLLNFYFQWLNPEKGEALAEVKKQHVETLVIRPAPKQEREALAKLVSRILAAKKKSADADTSELEREIDERVYHLYGLTPEEIQIVKDSGK